MAFVTLTCAEERRVILLSSMVCLFLFSKSPCSQHVFTFYCTFLLTSSAQSRARMAELGEGEEAAAVRGAKANRTRRCQNVENGANDYPGVISDVKIGEHMAGRVFKLDGKLRCAWIG